MSGELFIGLTYVMVYPLFFSFRYYSILHVPCDYSVTAMIFQKFIISSTTRRGL